MKHEDSRGQTNYGATSGYIVLGARFYIVDLEMGRRTHNYDVMLKASVDGKGKTKLYSVLKQVLELQYRQNKHGKRSYIF